MFEMIICISDFSLLRNNRSLQEFQSTCCQGITFTVASSDAAITNMHFYFFVKLKVYKCISLCISLCILSKCINLFLSDQGW